MYTKKFLYYLKGVMNFQIPKSVICEKSEIFSCIVFNFTGTGYLVIACGSLTSSGTYVTGKLRSRFRGVSLYRQRNYTMLCVFFSSQLSSVCGR